HHIGRQRHGLGHGLLPIGGSADDDDALLQAQQRGDAVAHQPLIIYHQHPYRRHGHCRPRIHLLLLWAANPPLCLELVGDNRASRRAKHKPSSDNYELVRTSTAAGGAPGAIAGCRGTRAWMTVPAPGALVICNWPPTSSRRSRTPCKP